MGLLIFRDAYKYFILYTVIFYKKIGFTSIIVVKIVRTVCILYKKLNNSSVHNSVPSIEQVYIFVRPFRVSIKPFC